MLKIKLSFFLIIQFAFSTIGNTQAYTINHFQSTYDTLTNYNSLTLELITAGESPDFWDHEFAFGFNFPFFGTQFSGVNMDSDAVGFFPGSASYNLFLFSNTYTIGNVVDTNYLESEVRYKSTTSNNLQVFIIEYHNIYQDYEYSDNGANHFLNLQFWFYDNGTIELHFGEIDLVNCSYYFPGQGFSFDNQNPTGNIYGPYVSINNDSYTEGACLYGDHTNPTILYDDDANCGVLTSIPPAGFVVQFLPSNLSTLDEVSAVTTNQFQLIQQQGVVEVRGKMDTYKSSTFFDILGREIDFTTDNKFSIPGIRNQLCFVVNESEFGKETHKLLIK